MTAESHENSTRDEPEARREELLLQRALDGELRPSEKAELDRLLAEDAGLRQQKRRGELQSEFFQADRDLDLPPPLGLDFADRVLASLEETSALAEPDLSQATGSRGAEPIRLGRWILAAAILLAVLLVGQLLTRPAPQEEMRAGTREADKILQELDRSSQERAARPAGHRPVEIEKK